MQVSGERKPRRRTRGWSPAAGDGEEVVLAIAERVDRLAVRPTGWTPEEVGMTSLLLFSLEGGEQ